MRYRGRNGIHRAFEWAVSGPDEAGVVDKDGAHWIVPAVKLLPENVAEAINFRNQLMLAGVPGSQFTRYPGLMLWWQDLKQAGVRSANGPSVVK